MGAESGLNDDVGSANESKSLRWRPASFLGALVPYAILAATQTAPGPKVNFSHSVAPIFKAHCASCHGASSSAGGLDLTSVAGIKRGGASGGLLKVGDPQGSLLMKRITGLIGPQMPMGMPALSAVDRTTIAQWVSQGALFDTDSNPRHWAYVAPVTPKVPILNSTWVRNPIDAFVFARLKKEGLRPSPTASKETLIRRVSLDLTGLPPTLQEVDAFLADKSPHAYEKVVDRLLNSPHYGERQARGWLDLARYADTDGYEKDLNRTAWEYRDWVIDAYNRNLPYDRFTIDQIAGDLLPNATVEDRVATGFQRNTMQNLEGGVDQEEAHFAVVLDRAETTATVWLGSTLGCARCHDHKYDPFSQRDYYKMAAFYSNTAIYPRGDKKVGEEKWLEAELPVPTKEQAAELSTLHADISRLQGQLERAKSELDVDVAPSGLDSKKMGARRSLGLSPSLMAEYQKWRQHAQEALDWMPRIPVAAKSAGGAARHRSPVRSRPSKRSGSGQGHVRREL